MIPPFVGSGATPQALFNAACSWPNTPVAPSTRATTLRMAGSELPPGRSALARMVWIWLAPAGPIALRICASMLPWMSWGSSTAPRMVSRRTRRGGREKTV